jgi:hypothetical protein
MKSAFTRQFRHRARRFLPGPTRPPGLTTRLPVRPARFAVGLGEPVRWAEFPSTGSAPLLPAFYLGRVEEVSPEGSVLVVLWERPSGRELSTALSAERDFPAGGRPVPGDLLRVWTWVELREREDGRCDQVEQIRVEREPPRLTEGERESLIALVVELNLLSEEARGEEEAQESLRKREAEWERIRAELAETPSEAEESEDEA